MKRLEAIFKNLNNNLKWKLKNRTEKLMVELGFGKGTLTRETKTNG